ncbi:MAG TPA: pyridoxamine 5'-phosphate oxidase family protein [Steroidobacteraceae bacterium]
MNRTGSSSPGEFAQLCDIVRTVEVALLTTYQRRGGPHTRPIQTLAVDEAERVLWFFTDRNSPKACEVSIDRHVTLGYSKPSKGLFAVVYGVARMLHDPAQARRLWRLEQRAYYPNGPADSHLGLLRVHIEHAEYWITPGRLSHWVAAARAAVTGNPARIIGQNCKVDHGEPRRTESLS